MSCNTAHWAVAKLLDPGKSLPSFRPLMTAHFDLCPNAAKIGARGAEMLFFVLITGCCCAGDSGHYQKAPGRDGR